MYRFFLIDWKERHPKSTPSNWSCWLVKVEILLGYFKLLSGLWSIWSAWHLSKLTMILICNTNYVCWSVPSGWHTMTYPTFYFWATVSGWPKKNLPSNFELMMFFGAKKPGRRRWVSWFSRSRFLLEILCHLCHWIHQLFVNVDGCFTWTKKQNGKGETSITSTFKGVPIKPEGDGEVTPFSNHLAPLWRCWYIIINFGGSMLVF